MKRRLKPLLRLCRAALALALLGLALAPPARADDWPQFRRDIARTGASGDPVKLPLVEVWSRESDPVAIPPRVAGAVTATSKTYTAHGRKGPYPPTSTVAVWKERIYYISSQ